MHLANLINDWTISMPTDNNTPNSVSAAHDEIFGLPHNPKIAELPALIEIAVARQSDVLVITSAVGTADQIIYASPAIARHTGYLPAEVIGKTPRMFQGPETSRATLSQIRAAVDARLPIRAELLNYHKNGSTFWTEIAIAPIFDSTGKATHMVSVQRDVTDRKAMQDAMRRKDLRFLQALEASANAIWDWNITTDALTYRDDLPGKSWKGQNHGILSGKGTETILSLVHPEDQARVEQSLRAILDGSERILVQEYRLRRPNGSFADVSDRQFVLRAPDGTAERVIGSILDISEKRELEDRRQQSQRLELLGEMTAGIAHNFNNLLTVIVGNVNRLRDDNMEPGMVLSAIRMIDEAAQRGAALTESLVSFSQIKKISLKSVNLRRLIDAMEPVWRNLLPPEILLEVQHAPDLWPASTDKVHLEAAILNLVINSRDAMPDGGLLKIETENIEAGSPVLRTRNGEADARFVMIRVSDSGIGMPPGDVKAAFDPFFTTKPPGKGTGLGLSSAYGFMKQSGGFVRLESTVGKGTALCIFLKAATDPPEPDVRAKPRHLVSDHGHRVLVVEDDPLVREYVWTLLTSLNYKVTTAANGEDALVLLASDQRVDLLFTDILMEGGVNGWQLAERAQELRPDMPILFTSAYPDAAPRPSDAAVGQIRILRKPYRPGELSVAILAAIHPERRPEIEA